MPVYPRGAVRRVGPEVLTWPPVVGASWYNPAPSTNTEFVFPRYPARGRVGPMVLRAGRRAAYYTAPFHQYPMAAAAGTFTVTGNATGLSAQRKLTAAAGTFSLVGQSAGLFVGLRLTAASGPFALAGVAVSLFVNRKWPVGSGTFTLGGVAAALRAGRRLTAGPGAFGLGGVSAGLLVARRLSAAAGAFVSEGSAEFRVLRVLPAERGAFAAEDGGTALRMARLLVAAPGAFALTGFGLYVPSRGPFTATIADGPRGWATVDVLGRGYARIDLEPRGSATITAMRLYHVGDGPTLSMTYRDRNGPRNPTALTVFVWRAGETPHTYAAGDCVHDGEGLYHLDLPRLTSADAGRWYYRTEAEGDVVAGTPDGYFDVIPSVT